MEVVTVSMYMTPVILSLMMQLVHMVANPGMVTTSMASGLEDASGALSGDSSFFKQAMSPLESHGLASLVRQPPILVLVRKVLVV